MEIAIADWAFRVNTTATLERTTSYSTDHCLCAYCRNYYENMDGANPRLRGVLDKFGIYMEGPCEVMPLEGNVILACYRVDGEILSFGKTHIFVDDVRIFPEAGENGTFLFWIGAMVLPWTQDEPMEDVLSPANEPEFLDRMARKWMELTDSDFMLS